MSDLDENDEDVTSDTVLQLEELLSELIAENIKQFFKTSGPSDYAIDLMQTLLNTEEELENRQTAGSLLKGFVFDTWKECTRLFHDPPAVSSVVKTRIRTMLLNGLSDAISEIRNLTASILGSIAWLDFPDDWPDMCESIFARLQNADSNTCSGILAFIKELNLTCSFYLRDNNSDKVYPLLYEIAQNTVRYSTKIRADAIYLFGNTSTLCPKEENNRLDRYRLFSEFCYMCKNELLLSHSDESDYYLKGAIIKSYMMLVSQAKENLTTTMANILPAIWQLLFRCGHMFEKMLVKQTFPNRDPLETVDECPLFYTLVYNILELLCVLLEAQLLRQEILMVLSDLLYYLVLFMGIPKDIEDRWRSDSNAYFGEEFNDESYNTSMRIKARDLLLVMTRELPAGLLLNALAMTVNQHTFISKRKGESYYWRVMEAVMFAIGSIKTFILNRYGTDELQHFDIHRYLSQWVEMMDPCPISFMEARIIWVGGCYALILEEDILSSYLIYTICNLNKPSYILKYSAIRAIYLHVAAITMSKHRAVYMQFRHYITDAMMCAIGDLEGDVLHLGLLTLQLLLNVPPLYIKTVQHEVITLINKIIMKNITRPEFLTDCLPIVKSLTVSVPCRKALETELLPFISDAIHEADPSVHPDLASLFEAEATIIDIQNVIVKYSPEPLSDNMFHYSFMAVLASIFEFDNPRIIQSGVHFLQSYLCKGAAQVASVTYKTGRTGADHILDVLKHLLDSNNMKLACKQVGRFFITALHMLGPQLQPHTDILLRALLSSVQRADTLRVEESLFIIFAYLFYYHLEPTINYLKSTPGPEGQSAFEFILDRWLSINFNYGGKYSGKLNVLAFTRLIEHNILQQDQCIVDIKIAATRNSIPLAASKSETDLDRFCVEAPMVLKVIKYLIYVLQREIKLAEGGRPGVESSEISLISTTPGSSRNPDSVAAIYEQYKQQCRMDSVRDGADDSDYCDILDIHLDVQDSTNPIYDMKITEFLTNFFKNFSENVIFMLYLQYLPNCDKKVLLDIGVNINVEDSEGDE